MDKNETMTAIDDLVKMLSVGAFDPHARGERVTLELPVLAVIHLGIALHNEARNHPDMAEAVLSEMLLLALPTADHMIKVREERGATNRPGDDLAANGLGAVADLLGYKRSPEDKQSREDFVAQMRKVFAQDQSGEATDS